MSSSLLTRLFNSNAIRPASEGGSSNAPFTPGVLKQVSHAITDRLKPRQSRLDSKLRRAAFRGDLAATEKYLGKGAGANEPSRKTGRTPVHNAALSGKADVMTALMARGVIMNVTDHRDETPLGLATAANHSEIVHLILANDSEVSNDAREALMRATNVPLPAQLDRTPPPAYEGHFDPRVAPPEYSKQQSIVNGPPPSVFPPPAYSVEPPEGGVTKNPFEPK